jgi:hypothetical protein
MTLALLVIAPLWAGPFRQWNGGVDRQILTALEAMAPLVDRVPENERRSIDLTGLGAAFGQS